MPEVWLRVAHELADAADALGMAAFRRDVAIERKPDRTYVTDADRAIERELRARLRTAFPDHGVVGEEYGVERPGAATRWYLDPIDGTHNFMRGIPLWGTLIGVEHEGELLVGVMSAPALGERWWAARGAGAWNRGRGGERRLAVSGIGALGDAQIVHAGGRATERAMPGFGRLLDAAWRERGFGDFWGYALVAEGAAEAMVEPGLSPWDAAAPIVVVEEAGGRMTNLDGGQRLDAGSWVATNGLLHDEILGRLRVGA